MDEKVGNEYNNAYMYMFIRSEVVEVRRGQTHLGTYFSAQSQARRIQARCSKFFSILGHLNFTDCFGGKGFALDLSNGLQALSKPFLFLSTRRRYLTLERVSRLQMLYITNVSSEEEPGHFLFYHYTTVYKSITYFTTTHCMSMATP